MEKQKVYLDYNEIAERVKDMLPTIYAQSLGGVVICLGGGSMLGMHLANLLKVPYSFITYNPFTIQPMWLGAPLKGERLLVVTDYSGTEAFLAKKLLEHEGYSPYFCTVYKDENGKIEPEFTIYDNTGLYQEIILPWENSFELDKALSLEKYKEQNTEVNPFGDGLTKRGINSLSKPTLDSMYIKDKAYWFISKASFRQAKIAPNDDYLLLDILPEPLTRHELANKVNIVSKQEGFNHIVVEDQTTAIVLSSMYQNLNIYLLINGTLVKIKATRAKANQEYQNQLAQRRQYQLSMQQQTKQDTKTEDTTKPKETGNKKRRGFFSLGKA